MPEVTSRLDSMVDDLRAYVSELENELARARRALNALTVLDGPGHPSQREDQGGLNRMLREVLSEAYPEALDARTAQQKLFERGWTTESKDPVNTVRSALARLVSADEAEKVPNTRGQYRWMDAHAGVQDADEVTDQDGEGSDDDDSEGYDRERDMRAMESDDPWGSAPASFTPSRGGFSDEPPF